MRPVPTNCIAAIAATAINAAMSAYSMAVTPDPSLISFKKSVRNRVILGLMGTHAQIADQNVKEFLNRTNEPGGGGLMAPFREPRHCPYSPDLVKSGTMQSFAASRLCGRAVTAAQAAIVVVSPPLGRFHCGAGLF